MIRSASVLVLAACALLVPAAVADAAPRDPVVAAINRALARAEITPMHAARLRRTWAASARAQRRAPTATRRANVAAVRAYTIRLARSGGLVAARLEPVLLSVRATSYVMVEHDEFPSHEQELQIPGEVAIFTYYWARGVQLQPFETFKQGLREVNRRSPDVEAARAIADRMLELDVPRGSSTTWEFYFPFGGPSRPWTSSISQAIATEFYHRVATLVPAEERAPYDAAAAGAAASFVRSTRHGGVAVPEGDGRFYVMYPFAPSQRILNGHLQVLINLNRYATGSGSRVARTVVTLGLRGVLPILPKFDTGAWSNYLPGKEADLNYHEFQTSQLIKLGDELAHPVLQEYGARFTQYLETPPQLQATDTGWPSIIPARDGFRDRILIRYSIDKRARVTMVIRDLEGREVRRISSWQATGARTIAWDGRDAKRAVVADGEYAATFTVTDVARNRQSTTLSSLLRVEHDRLAPELRLITLRESAGVSVVTVGARDLGSGWVDVALRIDGRLVAGRRGPRAGTTTLRIRRALADVRRGTLVLRDASGNVLVQPLTV